MVELTLSRFKLDACKLGTQCPGSAVSSLGTIHEDVHVTAKGKEVLKPVMYSWALFSSRK